MTALYHALSGVLKRLGRADINPGTPGDPSDPEFGVWYDTWEDTY